MFIPTPLHSLPHCLAPTPRRILYHPAQASTLLPSSLKVPSFRLLPITLLPSFHLPIPATPMLCLLSENLLRLVPLLILNHSPHQHLYLQFLFQHHHLVHPPPVHSTLIPLNPD